MFPDGGRKGNTAERQGERVVETERGGCGDGKSGEKERSERGRARGGRGRLSRNRFATVKLSHAVTFEPARSSHPSTIPRSWHYSTNQEKERD